MSVEGSLTPSVARSIARGPKYATARRIFTALAPIVFVVLAVMARRHDYFPFDVVITRGLQRVHHPIFDAVMYAISWLGFQPQATIIGVLVMLVLLARGHRREAGGALLAIGVSLVVILVKLIVHRPRPAETLVRVLSMLDSPSFPSGHVALATSYCGFFFYVVATRTKPTWVRRTMLFLLGLIVALMGPSRIYLGQHWFSDTVGAYLLGTLWLELTLRWYETPGWPRRRGARGR